jgi:predicted GNAT family acetyltransferase
MVRAAGRRVSSPGEFRAAAGRLLEADEARHTVMLGVIGSLEHTPQRYDEHHLWVWEEDGVARAAATWTPPFHVLVARPETAGALQELAGVVHRDRPDVPGVNGALPEAAQFAEAWARLSGCRPREQMRLCLHRLDRLAELEPAPGRMRAARRDERDQLVAWMVAFSEEAGLQGGAADLERGIDARLGAGLGLVVWDVEGAAVSLAGSTVTSPGCARVGPVYTPPDLRGHGYATSLVSDLTRALGAAGNHTLVLFTDLANPTSNSIYRRIGYQPIGEAVQLDFEPG